MLAASRDFRLNQPMNSLRVLLACLLLASLSVGCSRKYAITTNSGRVITTQGKPAYDQANSCFRYKDARGEARSIPAGSVREISPASDVRDETGFNPKPSR
jgi:hypothetical protein